MLKPVIYAPLFMPRYLCTTILISLFLSAPALADEPLKGRAEANWRYGSERSILMTEFWVPIAQDEDGVFYGDLRMMGDDQDNREGNLGVGYRQITTVPFLDKKGVIGINGWLDRRITERGSKFHQVTAGAEWLGESVDLRLNGYIPLSDAREIETPNANPQAPALAGTGIVVDTNGRVLEEPQHGFDIELGWELGSQFDFIRENTDSFRVYGGAYYFDGEHTENVAGWRTRFTADVSENVQIGARFQRDDERGSQGFLEATFRFPFGNKKSYRREGLRARLDESPERDIDIVTGTQVTDTGDRVAVVNKATGQAQEILTVDNTAAGGGDGSAENPFNTLAAAEAAASAHTIIYVKRGDGTSTNQNQGITLNKTGQQLIGSGANFVFDSGTFTTANGGTPTSLLIAAAGAAPTIGNVNALGDGVRITADNVSVAGLTIDNGGTGRDGIVVEADGAAASAQNITIQNVTTQNARMGIYLHGTNSGAVSAKVQNSVTTSNSQHGIAVYDDTDDTFEVDLGGGSMGSVGNNVLAGNTLEDLAIDYDGRTLAAMNNWWGQASGPDTDTPDIGIAPQIYYGAPINDGLVGHWTFDAEWTTNTTAYDRSGQGNNGTLQGGLSLADMTSASYRQGLSFDGNNDKIVIAHDPDFETENFTSLTYFTLLSDPNTNASNNWRSFLNMGSTSASSTGWDIVLEQHRGLQFDLGNSGVTVRSGGINVGLAIGTPIAVGFSFDDTTKDREIYIDGASFLKTNLPAVNYAPNTSANFGISAGVNAGPTPNGAGYVNGLYDEVRIYNRAITAPEVAELYRMNTSSVVNTGSFLTTAP